MLRIDTTSKEWGPLPGHQWGFLTATATVTATARHGDGGSEPQHAAAVADLCRTSKAAKNEIVSLAQEGFKQIEADALAWITSHSFRKTNATILDDAGLSTRQIADQLGHARPSLTMDVYLGRGARAGRRRCTAGRRWRGHV